MKQERAKKSTGKAVRNESKKVPKKGILESPVPELKQSEHYDVVEENAVALYHLPLGSNPGLRRASALLFSAGRPEWQMTPVEKMDMAKEGVTKEKLETLKKKTNLDYDKLSSILSTTRATLINKKGKGVFSASLGEKIISIADLYSYGFEVFEDEAKFKAWIFKPNQALGGKQPFELLDNQFGREEVKNLIGRIDYGVYS